MQVLRYANRVPLQFQPAACAITQSVIGNNWRSYGLSQSRGNLPAGRSRSWCTWPASGCRSPANRKKRSPAIRKSEGAAARPAGRGPQAGHVPQPAQTVQQEGERREIFLRYLGEVATRRRARSRLRRSPEKGSLRPAAVTSRNEDGRGGYASWTTRQESVEATLPRNLARMC